MLTRCGRTLSFLTILLVALLTRAALGQQQSPIDPLPSWNEGTTKQAILEFVHAATDKAGPKYVPPEDRIATFDLDGTLWVEHPMYTQVVYCLDRVKAIVRHRPHLKDLAPFKTVLSGNHEAIAQWRREQSEARSRSSRKKIGNGEEHEESTDRPGGATGP